MDTAVGTGSSFRVYLPATEGPAGNRSAAELAEEVRGGTETILLVEDDPPWRRTTALCLRKLGYGVLVAANAAEALKLRNQHQQLTKVLLTDMVMPEPMTGLDLAERFKREKAGLRIIITSGYSTDLSSPRPPGPEIAFLPKPFQPSRLAKVVRHCLDRT